MRANKILSYCVRSTMSLRNTALRCCGNLPEGYPCYNIPCNAPYVIASENMGTPRDTFVPVGKRNKQAKDKQLSFTAIVWSKVKFMTRNVRRCHYDNDYCQYSQHTTFFIFKKIFKKFELNKTKNGGFPKSGFPFLPENTSVLTKRRRFCIIKL